MNELNRPLVTFALFAYNQERFIREAVEGALAQDYESLEIILSDDCSTDRTFEIIQSMVTDYSGHHKIRLNRNIKNLGIAGHLNYLMNLVNTDFVVVAAGDDFSLPSRVSELTAVWIESERRIKSVHSYAEDMNENGMLTGKFRRGFESLSLSNPSVHASSNIGVLGATHAWDMGLIRDFESILPSVINEDIVIPARASIVGGVGFVSKNLVNYRIDVGVSHEVTRNRFAGIFELSPSLMKRPYYSFLQKFRDYKKFNILNQHILSFRRSRAAALFPLWLRIGYRSPRKISYFICRCSAKHLFWEIIKYKFPKLVRFKQRIQFWKKARIDALSGCRKSISL